MQFARLFRLSDTIGRGVHCNRDGLHVGSTPLLERVESAERGATLRPRSLAAIRDELSAVYDLPVAFAAKVDGLATVAGALDRGDLVRAQIAALLLGLPDPPDVAKSERSPNDINELAKKLEASGLLEAAWDPTKHPRWPAKSPDGVGGQFAPTDAVYDSGDTSVSIVQAQIAIPAPSIEIPVPIPLPLPFEIVPPIIAPYILPRSLPQNPYPGRPECVREWQDAYDFCWNLKSTGRLGRGDWRGMGKTLRDCILGQVTERCGGLSTST